MSTPAPGAAGSPAGRRSRGGFGPVVLAGLASAALAALASSRPWVALEGAGARGTTDGGALPGGSVAADAGTTYPLASAVSLVLLAAWGVLLVTRGRVRRGFAVLAALAAVGLLATVVTGGLTLPGSAGDDLATSLGRPGASAGLTGWFWTSLVAAVLAVVPAVVAVRRVPSWPEMGARYDAPADAAEAARQRGPATEQELWKALDEGRDPTDPERGVGDEGRAP
ncbi:hypothetical protein ASG49_15905 [Marmoricola sp. Leaf446]|uniref:Trp biosynthesis-associated membrane protein n=1 Tax=Marmoricola sp. Leaf446 TaxID=1736379 RepID=UPI0006F4D6B1|nr:Trp biosynthesis-associated membrane protein [Marmoricola sp. Leaf446]KQT89270.1 hypothetical protein ASG49_15905 [Marmoricola sp. Leaf446]